MYTYWDLGLDHNRSPLIIAPCLTDKAAQSMRFSGHGMAAGTRAGGAPAAATPGAPAGAAAVAGRDPGEQGAQYSQKS